ncbi:MAG: molybdate ABC transporter substrate-binding protein [Rhodopseudomonas palustris]|nr:molybdate ABC transporter substrate-binding protein [Rhodopseudomonas palustris]
MKFIMPLKLALLGAAVACITSSQALADSANIAVAANFTSPAKEIAAAFKAKTGHEAVLSFGSSGQFFTQISQDAPFQVFLSAGFARPKKLVEDGLAKDSRFTYAIRRAGAVECTAPGAVGDQGEQALKASGRFAKLADLPPRSPAPLWRRRRASRLLQALRV